MQTRGDAESAAGGTPAVFVDRDGTLIREVGYLTRPEQIQILPRVPEAIGSLRRRGLKIAVVTNQSVIGRGLLTEEGLELIHRKLKNLLLQAGAPVDGIYYCPHHPTEALEPYRVSCRCRKPDTGLVEEAAGELHLDVRRSYVVGDQASDMELAARIGAKGIRIQMNEDARMTPTDGWEPVVVKNFWEAAQWILRDQSREKAG